MGSLDSHSLGDHVVSTTTTSTSTITAAATSKRWAQSMVAFFSRIKVQFSRLIIFLSFYVRLIISGKAYFVMCTRKNRAFFGPFSAKHKEIIITCKFNWLYWKGNSDKYISHVENRESARINNIYA